MNDLLLKLNGGEVDGCKSHLRPRPAFFILAHQVCAVSLLPSATEARQQFCYSALQWTPSLSQAAFSTTPALSRTRATGNFETLLL